VSPALATATGDPATARRVRPLWRIGPTLVDDRRKLDGAGWAVLADPEGNELCVLRSAAERVGS
jgi:hypothetical protein